MELSKHFLLLGYTAAESTVSWSSFCA